MRAGDTLVRRTMLFVPGDRYERIQKSVGLSADSIILDLEDAVAISQKETARGFVGKALQELDFKGKEKVVRINSLRTLEGLHDILFLSGLTCYPDAVMVPKVETAGEITQVASLLDGIKSEIKIIPLLESAAGVMAAKEIAVASSKINGLFFGGGDFAGELGCAMDWESLYHARAAIVLAAACAKLDVFDVPYLDVTDLEGLEMEASRAAQMGFTGKGVIHPRQIATVNKVFTPSAADIEWAQRVTAALGNSVSGALAVDGKMIDAAIVKRAEKIIKSARQLSLL